MKITKWEVLVFLILVVCVLGLFLCRSFVVCSVTLPFSESTLSDVSDAYEDCVILDELFVSDSALILIGTGDGKVRVLELQRDLFLPRYAVQEDNLIEDDAEYITVAYTVQSLYPYMVRDRSKIILDGTIDTSWQWPLVLRMYITPITPVVVYVLAVVVGHWKKKNS